MPRLTNSGKVPDLPRKAFFTEHHMVHLASLPIRTAYLGSHTKKAGGSLAVALCWALRQVSVIPLYFSPTNRANLQKRRDVSTGTEAIAILHPRGGRSLDWIVRRKPQVKPVHGRKSRILRSCLFLQVRQQSTSVGRCHRETQVVASDYKGLSTCGQSDSFPVGFHQQSLIESTTQAFFAYAEVA